MQKDIYVQCEVTKGSSTRVFWGNSDKAVVGNNVRIEENDGSWSEGWTIKAVYGEARPKTEVMHQSHAHTRQRKASDI